MDLPMRNFVLVQLLRALLFCLHEVAVAVEVALLNCGDDRLLEVALDFGEEALSDVWITGFLFYLGDLGALLFLLGQVDLGLFLNPETI
jgi:hypothetical protein